MSNTLPYDANPAEKMDVEAYPMTDGRYESLTADNAVMLLIDHQVGLLQTVRDVRTTEEFKNNVLGLAKTAKAVGMPVVLSTSVDIGPNGPILPELTEIHPDAPLIRRPGPINAWSWPEFREAVEDVGREKVVIAAITADTCLQFPALDMIKEGYDVHGVIDASGGWSPVVRDVVIPRLATADVNVTNWVSVACELQADWRAETAEAMADVFHEHLPSWGLLMDSYVQHQTDIEAATKAMDATEVAGE